jgi:hypothetical protein
MKRTLLLAAVAVILMVILYGAAVAKPELEPVNNVSERVADQAAASAVED